MTIRHCSCHADLVSYSSFYISSNICFLKCVFSPVCNTVLNKYICRSKWTSEQQQILHKHLRKLHIYLRTCVCTQLLSIYTLMHRITLCTHSVLLPLQERKHLYVRAQWSEQNDRIIQFIQVVEMCPMLWDTSNIYYKWCN